LNSEPPPIAANIAVDVFGPTPRDFGDPLANFTGFRDRFDLSIKSLDVLIDLEHEGVQAGDDFPHHLLNSSLAGARIFGNQLAGSCGRDGDCDAAIEQESTHLANECGSMIDQPLPGAVKRLDVLLFERLLRHEPHVPLLDRRADRFGVVGIVLLPAHEGNERSDNC
jgi:hypothetical protein